MRTWIVLKLTAPVNCKLIAWGHHSYLFALVLLSIRWSKICCLHPVLYEVIRAIFAFVLFCMRWESIDATRCVSLSHLQPVLELCRTTLTRALQYHMYHSDQSTVVTHVPHWLEYCSNTPHWREHYSNLLQWPQYCMQCYITMARVLQCQTTMARLLQ